MRLHKPALVLTVMVSAACAPHAVALNVTHAAHSDRAASNGGQYRLWRRSHGGANASAHARAQNASAHARAQNAPAHARAHESVIGGTSAADGTFPSLAYILDVQGKSVYQCTGTVVAPSLILTAGHCAENMKSGVVNRASGYRVVTGTVDPMLPEPHVSTVLGVIVYPGLVRRVDEGDAALLVLSAPTAAPTITLATSAEVSRLKAGSPAVMAGWGLTSFTQTLPTDRLQSAATVLQGRKWCTANAPPFYPNNEICSIAPPGYNTGACAGDSGGPLLAQQHTGGEPIQIGIAVHVYGPCSTRLPSVFVNVGSISSWINTWIDAYKLPPTPSPAPAPPPPAPIPTSPVPLSR